MKVYLSPKRRNENHGAEPRARANDPICHVLCGKMKIAILFLALCATAFPQQDSVGILGFKYIDDQKAFVAENSTYLSAEQQRALNAAKVFLALYLNAEIQGQFSIAEASWGFQVNFSGLKKRKDKTWTEVTEGFGNIFISKRMDRIRIDYGP